MIVLTLIKWAVIIYLLAGFAIVCLAIWFNYAERNNNSANAYQFTHQLDWIKTADWKMRIVALLLAIWYGVFCWLPIAAGWMTRPTKFKF